MTRRFLIVTAVVVAFCLAWLGWDGWSYLQRGYSLGVSMAGRSASVFHIDFPAWRAAVHILLWVAAMSAVVIYIAGSRWASAAAWLAFAATLVVGIYDVAQYGTLGSPTSVWTVSLLLLLALLTTFGRLATEAES